VDVQDLDIQTFHKSIKDVLVGKLTTIVIDLDLNFAA